MTTDARAPQRYVWSTVALTLAGAVWYVLHSSIGAGHVAAAYVIMPVSAAVAAFAVHRMVRTVGLDPVACRFWQGLAVALVLLTIGYGILALHVARNTVDGVPPNMTTPAAAFAGLGLVVAMWAVGRVPTGADDAARWRMVLDRTIAFLGCSTLLWHFGLAPMLSASEPWSNQSISIIALAYLLAVGGITKVSYIGDGPVDRTALRLVASIGLAAAGVAVLAVTFGNDGGLPAQAVVMPFSLVLVALAVRAQWGAVLTPRPPARRSGTLLPYLAVGAVDVPLVAVAFGPMHWPGRVVVCAAVVVTALVTVRQFVAFRDNAGLLREKRASEVLLQHEVTHDGLTGLANRALFRDRLDTALTAGTAVTVLLIDLDDFKTVNDSLGHAVGDGLLVAVGAAMRDQVGDGGLPVRLGGDEFAVLLVDGLLVGETVARRILDALAEPIGDHGLLVQASVGIATAGPGASVDTVLRDADVAMYLAKQRGKAGWVRYLPGMEEPVLAHVQLGGELRRALDAHEFRLVYQPILALADHRVIGVEALVRWEHPTRGTVSPGEFIPAAERTGLIVPLGRFVLRETCRQMAAWLAEFGPDALQKAGANVSARQLHDPDFVAEVRAALDDSGLPTDRLVLELTESAVLRGQQVSRTLHELDAMGVKLALDDFGTGESSLSLLRSFPVAIVKLDKSFVDGIEIDDGNPAAYDARQAVARAVIQLAGALRLDTVAEGIENEAQARRLFELGYSLGQGFHLARPMSAEAMSQLLAEQRRAVTAV